MAYGYPRRVRMLAMVSVLMDTGAGVDELCTLRLRISPPPWGGWGKSTFDDTPGTPRHRPDSPVSIEAYRGAGPPGPPCSATPWRAARYGASKPSTGLPVPPCRTTRGTGGPTGPRGVPRDHRPSWDAPGWSPLPVRRVELQRGVAQPELYLVPPAWDAARAPKEMDGFQAWPCRPARCRPAGARDAATTGRDARGEARPGARCRGARPRAERGAADLAPSTSSRPCCADPIAAGVRAADATRVRD